MLNPQACAIKKCWFQAAISLFMTRVIMSTLPGNIPNHCHSKIRHLAAYWLSIHPASGLPGRQHFEPLDVPSLLPHLFLVDVDQAGPAFTFRLMGTSLSTVYGGDHRGQPFEKAYEAGKKAPPYLDACKMLIDKQPRWRKAPASFRRDQEYLMMERVMFPLAKNGVTVNMLLGLVLAHLNDGQIR